MKKIVLFLSFCLCLGSFYQVYGQSGSDKFHQHTGFYLSMSTGPAFGTINDKMTFPYQENFKFSGTGFLFDIKIGGAIKENLILHATLMSTALSGPKVTSSISGSGKASDNMNISENMTLGGGLTYYIMPNNIFLSGSIGMGNYSLIDIYNSTGAAGSTDSGFSMQLKIGKEWWVGKRWGLGIALTYGKTVVNNSSSEYAEKLNSNRIGILFNATLN